MLGMYIPNIRANWTWCVREDNGNIGKLKMIWLQWEQSDLRRLIVKNVICPVCRGWSYADPGGIGFNWKWEFLALKGTTCTFRLLKNISGLSDGCLLFKEAFKWWSNRKLIIGGVHNFSKLPQIDYVERNKKLVKLNSMACVRNGKFYLRKEVNRC